MAENKTETESQHLGPNIVTNQTNTRNLTNRKVIYIHNHELLQLSDSLMRIPGRASMVHSLIEAYGLLKYMCIKSPVKASDTDILQFHSPEYVDTIRRLSEQSILKPGDTSVEEDPDLSYDETALQCGLGYDCPVQHGLYDVAKYVVGGTVCAAESLIGKHCQVAINWTGGWHHAKRDEAAGFCYLNDIVLGILKLREQHDRVLYVDLDVHHGDGVEDAFCATAKVMTVSFHKYSTGFFPGTGSVNDIGVGRGKYYSINVPLKDGIRDPEFYAFFTRVLSRVREVYNPEVVVCQCGADGLTGDPMDSFNLTLLSLGRCVYYLLQWDLPLMLLGGGGYDHANTARCWTYITSIALNRKLPNDIPEHKYFTDYGPDYELHLKAGNRPNQNNKEYLNEIYHAVLGHLKKVEDLES